MIFNDVLTVLIVIFGLALVGLSVYLVLSTYVSKKDIKKIENKVLKETSIMDGLVKTKKKIGGMFKNKKNGNQNSNGPESNTIAQTEQAIEEQVNVPLTKEEREKQSNPFGVDMTRKLYKTNKSNPDNKFIK